MDAYIYSADLFCEFCGEAIRKRITDEGHAPANPDDEHTYDSDEFPKGPYSDGGGESDCPQNCADCHRPLGNALTTDGVEYVIQHILESLDDGEEARNAVHDDPHTPLNYYSGSRACEPVRDWAQEIAGYSLEAKDKFIVQHYLEVTEPKG